MITPDRCQIPTQILTPSSRQIFEHLHDLHVANRTALKWNAKKTFVPADSTSVVNLLDLGTLGPDNEMATTRLSSPRTAWR
jgi:hypothetical protein